MDIDSARKKGLCFNCGEQGHISRNCPQKKQKWTARAVTEGLDEKQRKELKDMLMSEEEKEEQGFCTGRD
jgi:hypothetical protein